jgi:hypothetical protein
MTQAGIDFSPQVAFGPADVVNPNGSTLDGSFVANGKTVLFDIKAFGFVEHLIAILKDKLEEKADGDEVLIQGGVAVSDHVQELIKRPGFDLLLKELRSNSWAQRGTLTFLKRQRRQVSISVLDLDAPRLAAENREYALRFGGQFARQSPFILIFVIHPWFTQGPLFHFPENHDIFCTEFARLIFQSFDHDTTIREGMPTNQFVKHLSAITFISVWPEPPSQDIGPTARVYLNATGLHQIVPADLASLQTRLGTQISITQI